MDEFLDDLEGRQALRLAPEHRRRLIAALVQYAAPVANAPAEEISTWVNATVDGQLTDDDVVREAERELLNARASQLRVIATLRDMGERVITAEQLANMFDEVRAARTSNATLENIEFGDAHVARAAQLKAAGLSAPVIGIRMAREEDEAGTKARRRRTGDAYSERVVRGWLAKARKRGDVTT